MEEKKKTNITSAIIVSVVILIVLMLFGYRISSVSLNLGIVSVDVEKPTEAPTATQSMPALAAAQKISGPRITPSTNEWSGILNARKPSLNEIRADNPVSIWIAENIEIRDMFAPGTDQYQGTVRQGKEYLIPIYWCTSSQELLQQNMDNMETTFTVNGEVVPEKFVFNYEYDENGWNCNYHAVVFGGWETGQQYTLQIKRDFKTDLSDGQNTYRAGNYIVELIASTK